MNAIKPPHKIPLSLINDYTLSGRIPVQYRYYDESTISLKKWGKEKIDKAINTAIKRMPGNYGPTDNDLYRALDMFSIDGKDVLVVGSFHPFYEGVALAYHAKKVIISEYNVPICDDNRIQYVFIDDISGKFDVIFSISTFEHDGLGRYGDPLNPNGDIEAMKAVKKLLKDGGMIFLSVPVGADCLSWNAHRIYGKIRLPMLLDGFDLVWSSVDLNLEKTYGLPIGKFIQPIFVLRLIVE